MWFRKERIIVNDEKFFASAELDPSADWNSDIEDRWDERDYVVASTVVKRQDGAKSKGAVVRDGRRADAAGKRGKAGKRPQEGVKASTKVRRHEEKSAPAKDIFDTKLQRTEVADSYEDEVFNVSNRPVSEAYASQDGEKK